VYEPGYLVAGKYELEAVLGQGGMGAVWRARNVDLDSLVAIKVLRAPVGHAALLDTRDHAALRSRLVQEARAAAKLTHPAIVKVFDVGQTEGGDPFIVMELLHGSSLGTILAAESRMPAIQVVRIMLPIADGLSLAHSKNIVHRDLKPDNLFIVHDAGAIQPKLVDFGIVKMQQGDVESHLTQRGAVLGSPDYMSPEQARGEDDIDLLTDVWSFSVVLYEAITGRCPFVSANYNALLRQIVEDTPPTPESLAAGDAELSAVIMRGMSKKRADRFASMGEYGRALATWLISQGVHDDICGARLEPRWLRGTDPHGRPVGRASVVSFSDAWPLEDSSGIRSSALNVNTLPAPPDLSPDPKVARLRAKKWPVVAGIVAVALLALGWLSLGDSRRAPVPGVVSATPAGRPPASEVTGEERTPARDLSADQEPAPAVEPSASAEAELGAAQAPNTGAAQRRPRKVSSSKGPTPAPPASTSKKGGSKPSSDLISPYQ
jgi:serine/threonine-protein kinase